MKKGESSVVFDETNEVLAIRWKDNALVTVFTNHGTIEPFANARRYDGKEKAYTNNKIPNTIAQYNKHMGGVDLHDNALANYRIALRSKKWWWPLFTNLLGNMMVNA
ncbi:PREDICTED: piggyBac transposable element-derived protein 2-like [Rhagoletis zephyria]|uniref:piggyBac transposable element-derived protein 2-like n=1 Tax=Rhagoletis zephyria TaxID=28612 RepID=UPI00081195D2|nr:PREDICTED: piggyBac transposable element-derived protein 2-like [Rhagoletis zephyria]